MDHLYLNRMTILDTADENSLTMTFTMTRQDLQEELQDYLDARCSDRQITLDDEKWERLVLSMREYMFDYWCRMVEGENLENMIATLQDWEEEEENIRAYS